MKAKSLLISLSVSGICMMGVGMIIGNVLLRVLTSANVTIDQQMISQWVTFSAILIIFIGAAWQIRSMYLKRP